MMNRLENAARQAQQVAEQGHFVVVARRITPSGRHSHTIESDRPLPIGAVLHTHPAAQQAAEPVADMTRAAAVKHIKATLAAFGPTAPITLAQDTWANLHDAMSILVAPTQHPLTAADVRRAGGIVHSDGNVFFTNLDMLNKAISGSKEGGAA